MMICLIQNYTDHRLEHLFRILEIIEKIFQFPKENLLLEDEIYVLLLCIFLHDIGMQCDMSTC